VLALLIGDLLTRTLQYLGIGGQIGVVALLLAVALYGRKLLSVGSVLRNAIGYLMVFAVLLAIVLAAGWGRLNVAQILNDTQMLYEHGSDLAANADVEMLRGLLP
jgi:hypothetical protein